MPRVPDAVQRAISAFTRVFDALWLRRAGTHAIRMDPGSAAHRHSASKTRVNALLALRSVRGTQQRGAD
jgi:hypothetical protein